MNEFIEQFLIECRELAAQATSDLLALEAAPEDADRLDSAFRAFHTLKGAAAIIDFAAMGRALHAVEEVLSAVRGAAAPVTTALVGDALTALDQVLQWLDVIEATGEPPPEAGAQADVVIALFETVEQAPPAIAEDWLTPLLSEHSAHRAQARTALRYRPAADSFFRGDDPLAAVEQVPGLLAVDVAPSSPWPALDDLDPFDCRLVLLALSSAGADEVANAFPPAADIELVTLEPAASGLPAAVVQVLEAQIAMLEVASGEGLAGRLGSAARSATSALRRAGAPVDRLQAALARALELRDPVQLTAALAEALQASAKEEAPAAVSATPEPATRALRVDVERIDALVRLTGELTTLKNAIGHISGLADTGADPALIAARLKDQHALLDRLVGELQHSVLSIRVLPLRHVFQRFPRLVRDLGQSLGKPLRLITEGDDTEADKAIVESLFEPLLHVMRNAADHGFEGPEARRALGKPETGVVTLRALRQGERVIVEVRDDGRGIDTERVRQVAISRGVDSPEAIAALSDVAVADLIFAPGFSTATTVTDVSGRGVGMDAVRAAVERMGGRVSLDSIAGQGTTVRFSLPFTVMKTQVMTVEAGGQAFGVPLDAVIETVRISRAAIVAVGAARATVLRDRTMPVFDLGEALGQDTGRTRADSATLIVIQVGDQRIGLEVDGLGDRMDVMLRPMEGLLAGMAGVTGTTLLGDGRVLIVLDVQELLS